MATLKELINSFHIKPSSQVTQEPSIRPTPRNSIVGGLADGLRNLKESTGVVGDFILGESPTVLDNLSYGTLGTKGSGLTTRMPEGLVDLVGLLPVGAASKVGNSAAKALPKLTKSALQEELLKLTGKSDPEAVKTLDAGVYVRNSMRDSGHLSGPKEADILTGRVKEIIDLYDSLGAKSNYLYHSTPSENLASIRNSGLVPGGGKPRFDISSPDSLYLASSQKGAEYFTNKGQNSTLRLKKNTPIEDLAQDLLGGEGSYVTKKPIPPELLEFRQNGKWVNLK